MEGVQMDPRGWLSSPATTPGSGVDRMSAERMLVSSTIISHALFVKRRRLDLMATELWDFEIDAGPGKQSCDFRA